MSRREFYREIQIIKTCRWCNKNVIRPLRFSWRANVGLCDKCIKFFNKRSWQWYLSLPPERKKEVFAQRKREWNRWVENNLERRRELLLQSYHKCKDKPERKVARKARRKLEYQKFKAAKEALQ